MRGTNKLHHRQIAKIQEPGRYGDGGGLWLQVSKIGDNVTKSWLYRYMLNGRARHMGLGPYPPVELADARERRDEEARKVAKGIDPVDERRARRQEAKAQAARQKTFRQCAAECIEALRPGWKNEKHAAQWQATLETYAYPKIGDLPVADVGVEHVLEIIRPIWTVKNETANRVRGRIEQILDYATPQYRNGENPARKRILKTKLASAEKVADRENFPSLPYVELPLFMTILRDKDFVSARALEFAILTVSRTGQTIEAKWDEIDLKAATWTIPGDRMKNGKQHVVPLAPRAVEILESLPRMDSGEYVFPGAKVGKPLSNMALLELVRGMNAAREKAGLSRWTDPRLGKDIVPHGFRSTFSDWAGDQTAFDNESIQFAMHHITADKTERAYRRMSALEKRTRLMTAWADYCASTPASGNNIVSIRGAVNV